MNNYHGQYLQYSSPIKIAGFSLGNEMVNKYCRDCNSSNKLYGNPYLCKKDPKKTSAITNILSRYFLSWARENTERTPSSYRKLQIWMQLSVRKLHQHRSNHEGTNFVQFICTISIIWLHRYVAPTAVYNRSKCQRNLINIPGGDALWIFSQNLLNFPNFLIFCKNYTQYQKSCFIEM